MSRPVLVLLGLLLLTIVGGTLTLLRLFGVFDDDWVAYVGFAMVLCSWLGTRVFRKRLTSERP